jgi:hypothetical protein
LRDCDSSEREWIEIVGGLAIIASVGLVIIETRQNTDAVSAQAVPLSLTKLTEGNP